MNRKTDWAMFVGLLGSLCEVFRDELTETKLELYWAALVDFDLAEIKQATGKAIQGCTFFPKPAELRAFAMDSWNQRLAAEQRQKTRALLLEPAMLTQDPRGRDIFAHWAGKCRPGCITCAEEKRHPRPDLHLKRFYPLVRGEISDAAWAQPAPGCCAPAEGRAPPPVAAGPKPVPPAVPKGGDGDWLSNHQEQEERRFR